MYRRYEVLIPPRFNDGTAVPTDLIATTLAELEKQFGAYSCETQNIQGRWNFQGQTYQDDLVRVFVDRYLIDELEGAELCLQSPRDEGVAFQLDQPWEGRFSTYTTIIRDGDKYRAYYRGLPDAGSEGARQETTCYAESADGKTWS